MGRLLKKPRQELFVREYIKASLNGENASVAYARVYKPKGFNCAAAGAWRILQKPHVKRRIREMRMDIKRKADISFEKILTDYQYALNLAKVKEEPASIIAAAREQAKLVGLLIDRKEIGAAGDFENMENISDILEAVAKQAGPEAALALSQAFGILGPANIVSVEMKKAPEPENSEALLEVKPASDAVN